MIRASFIQRGPQSEPEVVPLGQGAVHRRTIGYPRNERRRTVSAVEDGDYDSALPMSISLVGGAVGHDARC